MKIKTLTILIVPEGVNATRQIRLPHLTVKVCLFLFLMLCLGTGFIALDYIDLLHLRMNYRQVAAENEGLKGEARILIDNLEEVKRALRRVQDYTAKLGELTAVRVQSVSKKTGIGPLTEQEYLAALNAQETMPKRGSHYMPLGVDIEKLSFLPAFNTLASIDREANRHAFELQHLLSTLSQQRSLLSSIPSLAPVEGWITSGFGSRISPFTGDTSTHLGLDIAAPTGTPIHAPADGVIIFAGNKDGYGNFIMVAHGYGIVTRYGHNAQNMVQPGQRVNRGEQIGTVGATGRTTGPHLHYEIHVNGQNEDPQKFILDMSDLRMF